jgi:hypothetical protein
LKEEAQMANKYLKENFNIHKGNSYQNNTEISSHTSQNEYHEEQK